MISTLSIAPDSYFEHLCAGRSKDRLDRLDMIAACTSPLTVIRDCTRGGDISVCGHGRVGGGDLDATRKCLQADCPSTVVVESSTVSLFASCSVNSVRTISMVSLILQTFQHLQIIIENHVIGRGTKIRSAVPLVGMCNIDPVRVSQCGSNDQTLTKNDIHVGFTPLNFI